MGWGDSSDSSNSDAEDVMERRAAKRARGWAQRRQDGDGRDSPDPHLPNPAPAAGGEESLDAPLAPPSSPVPPLHGKPKGPKKNSVWADVLNEQTLTAELTRDVGVRSGAANEMVSRDVESFPIPPPSKTGSRDNAKTAEAKTVEDELNMELESYREAGTSKESEDPFADDHTMAPEPLAANGRKRFANHHRRGRGRGGGGRGNQRDIPVRIPLLDLKPDQNPVLLAGKLAEALKEPKRELMERVVNECGAEKAIELYKRTQTIQAGKGLRVADKSRLRTPGGVLLLLLREDASIAPDVKQRVFAEDKDKQRKFVKVKRRVRSDIANRSYEQILADARKLIEAKAKARERAKEDVEMEEGEVEEGELAEDDGPGQVEEDAVVEECVEEEEEDPDLPLGETAPEAPEILA